MTFKRFAVPGDGALAPDDISQLSSDFQNQALNLIASGYAADDVSGALTAVAIRILCTSDGQAATAQHLHELADRLKATADV